MRYAVVIERAGQNFSAYVPDLPGCVPTGESVETVEHEIREAIRFHIEGCALTDFGSRRQRASPNTSMRESPHR